MSKFVWLAALFAGFAWCQSIDFSALDKLEAKAKEVNRVTLDGKQLKGLMQMAPADSKKGEGFAEAAKIAPGLDNIVVRNYEFAEPGQYRDSDLDAIRRQIANLKGWTKIVESKEKNEHSEIYMFNDGDKPGGIAIISAEPKEVSVVFVRGALNFKDLGKLHGLMGLPNLDEPSKDDSSKQEKKGK
jgi:uncharacterized pyridoxal phosphate-containing UPF0001 family protein